MLQLFNNNRETLAKTCYMIKPFRYCKIQDTNRSFIKRQTSGTLSDNEWQ